MRLVQAVGEAAGDQGQVGALDAEHELGRGGDVGDRVGDAERSAGSAARACGGRHLLVRDHEHRLDALRRLEAHRGRCRSPASARGQRTKPP